MKRVVFVGGIAPSMFPNYKELTLYYKRVNIDELKELVKDAEVLNYVRHESTVKVLSEILGKQLTPSTELYIWREDDILVVVGLKKPVRGQEVEVSIKDLDLVMVRVFPGKWTP
jgi:hypothetical protein